MDAGTKPRDQLGLQFDIQPVHTAVEPGGRLEFRPSGRHGGDDAIDILLAVAGGKREEHDVALFRVMRDLRGKRAQIVGDFDRRGEVLRLCAARLHALDAENIPAEGG